MYPQQLTKIFKKPFYCGILAHAMLEGKVVEGKHEKLISPELFLKVNSIHQKSFNYGVPHKKVDDNLPLKVFVKCGDCKEPFTGYLVKKKGLFYYKCRTTGCKCNKSAKQLHEMFIKELEKLTIKEENIAPLQYALENVYYDLSKGSLQEEAALKIQLTEINKKIDSIEEKYFALGEMNKETFEKFNSRFQEEKKTIEENLQKCSCSISNLSSFVQEAISLSTKLNAVWASSVFSTKEKLQKLIFPEGVYYDRKNGSFRTEKINFIFCLIEANSGSCEANKKRTNDLLNRLSPLAEREGFEPALAIMLESIVSENEFLILTEMLT
jgi:site-specific DNA recombinase